MAYRTTKKELEAAVARLNEIAGTPLTAYSLGSDGKYHPNAGAYHLDGAYGGWQLAQLSKREGCTGAGHPLNSGFVSKRECLDGIHHFIKGILVGKEGQ